MRTFLVNFMNTGADVLLQSSVKLMLMYVEGNSNFYLFSFSGFVFPKIIFLIDTGCIFIFFPLMQ